MRTCCARIVMNGDGREKLRRIGDHEIDSIQGDALEVQHANFSEELPAEQKLLLCIGLGYGKILRTGDTDVWGAEVNAASKLGEDTARGGETLVTENAHTAAAPLRRADLELQTRDDILFPYYRVTPARPKE